MPQARPAELYNIKFRAGCKSRRLFASSAYASACTLRQSANAKGTPDSLSSVGVFIFKTTSFTNAPRLLCDVFLDFRSAPLAAAPRLLEGRRRGRARADFRIEPYVFRAGCRSAVRALPCADIDRARTPAEGRSYCPTLGSLYSRQRCSRRHAQACRRSASFSWTFAVAPLVAAPRLLEGRRRGRARADFRIEPYVTLHPKRVRLHKPLCGTLYRKWR